jgi:hypothetical protein
MEINPMIRETLRSFSITEEDGICICFLSTLIVDLLMYLLF